MTQRADDGREQLHRLDDVLGMGIRYADGTDGDQVSDLRLGRGDVVRGVMAELVVEGVIVGKRRPGSLMGYDRHRDQGPWAIRRVVRFLHRHTGYVGWHEVESIDWGRRVVHLRVNGLHDLDTQPRHVTGGQP